MPKHADIAAQVHVARISLPSEANVQITAASEAALEQQIASWCRENWAAASRRYPQLADEPPAEDSEVIDEYFELVDDEFREPDATSLDALTHTDELSEAALSTAYAELDALTAELLTQRAALARTLLHRIEARQTPEPDQQLAPADQRAVERLLRAIVSEESERHGAFTSELAAATDEVAANPPVDDGFAERSDREITQRIVDELPRRRFERRVRWSVAQLERILVLNDASSVPLAADERALREAVSENARALIDARRSPASSRGGRAAEVVQVAYLMPVEVIVDLKAQRVTRVVAIDESIELDAPEGAREQGTLAPHAPTQAAEAVAIADSTSEPWPATEFGF